MTKTTALVVALCALPIIANAQVLDFYGFTFPTGTGEGEMQMVGSVDEIFAPLISNPANEYTISITRLVPAAPQSQGGGWTLTPYTSGHFEVWEDAVHDLEYTPNPPNPMVPGTFENGTLYLEGDFLAFEVYRNSMVGIGSFQGDVTFTGGSAISGLGFAGGWTFGGSTTTAPGMPTGFVETWDGMFYMNSTATDLTSWGEVKELFR